MSLLDQVKEGEAAEKKAASKGSEYQKKAREERNAAAKVLRDWRAGAGKDVKFPEAVQAAFDTLTRERKAGSPHIGGKPVIYQIFGDAPKVGSKITALEVFQKTGKGFPEMKKAIKKWAESGIEVGYDEKSTSYVINKGEIAKYEE